MSAKKDDKRAVSSVGERLLDRQEVTGSNPVRLIKNWHYEIS